MIGKTAGAMCLDLLEFYPEISHLHFAQYTPAPPVSDATTAVGLHRRLRHAQGIICRDAVLRGDVAGYLEARDANHVPGTSLSVCSSVTVAGQTRHIAMVDFQTGAMIEDIVEGMRRIAERGVVIESTRSFHYYGTALLDGAAWRRFMGWSLLLDHIVDARWVGHCLIEGECALRVSRDSAGAFPKVHAMF